MSTGQTVKSQKSHASLSSSLTQTVKMEGNCDLVQCDLGSRDEITCYVCLLNFNVHLSIRPNAGGWLSAWERNQVWHRCGQISGKCVVHHQHHFEQKAQRSRVQMRGSDGPGTRGTTASAQHEVRASQHHCRLWVDICCSDVAVKMEVMTDVLSPQSTSSLKNDSV